jgi:uncharacterized membrane protein
VDSKQPEPVKKDIPAPSEKLAFKDKVADKMRLGMGTFTFLGIFLLFMGIWAVTNTVFLGKSAFDPYPYILLNLMLSMLAGLQGAILLISSKRSDGILDGIIKHIKHTSDDTRDAVYYIKDVNSDIEDLAKQVEALVKENTDLTKEVYHNGIVMMAVLQTIQDGKCLTSEQNDALIGISKDLIKDK